MDAARTILGRATDVRGFAAGRVENARMTAGAWWVVGIFGAVFVVFLLALHVIILPGGLVLILVYESAKPRRGVVVTGSGVVEFRLNGFNARPKSIIATADHGVLDPRRARPVGRRIGLTFGSETVVVRERDYATLLAAARHHAVPTPPSAHTPPVVPPPPSAYTPPAAPTLPPIPPPPATDRTWGIVLTPPEPPTRPPDEIARESVSRRRASLLMVVGAFIRLSSYVLPWIVASGTRTVSSNLVRLGISKVSLLFTGVALVLAIGYAAGRQWARPRLVAAIGVGALLGGLADLHRLGPLLTHLRTYLATHDYPSVRVGSGTGVWAELISAGLLIVGGVWAVHLGRRALPGEVPATSSAIPRDERVTGQGEWTIALTLTAVLMVFLALIPIPIGRQTASIVGMAPSPFPIVPSSPTPTPVMPPPPLPATIGGPDAVAYQANVAHDGNASGAHVRLPLREAWSRSFSDSVGYPLIAGGRVFVAVTGRPAGEYAKSVYALDGSTGRTLWRHSLKGGYSFVGLAYDRGALFAVTGDGVLHRYDPASGAARWVAHVPVSNMVEAPPIAWGGHVYLSDDTDLFSVEEQTGTVAWRAQTQGGGRGSPAIGGSLAFLDEACFSVQAFSVRDGSRAVDREGACQSFGSTIAYSNGRVATRERGVCTILEIPSWNDVTSFRCGPIPAFDGQSVYAVADGMLYAMDLATGTQRWSFAGDEKIVSAPLVVGHTVYAASSKGRLFAVDASGRPQGRFWLRGHVVAADEYNGVTLTGMNAGDGVLAVAVSDRLVVFR